MKNTKKEGFFLIRKREHYERIGNNIQKGVFEYKAVGFWE